MNRSNNKTKTKQKRIQKCGLLCLIYSRVAATHPANNKN